MRSRPRGRLLAPRLMAAVYRALLDRMLAEGWAAAAPAGAHRQAASALSRRPLQRVRMTVHVIGAGLAGLSAAIAVAGRGVRVIVSEAAKQAGGRCRSYHDGLLDMTIDNGNHLVLSGNGAVDRYLRDIGARGQADRARPRGVPLHRSSTGQALDAAARTTARCPGGSSMPTAACRARALRDYLVLLDPDAAPSRTPHRRESFAATPSCGRSSCGRCCCRP